ncbi:MAG: primosomal protein N' [Planctomycetales bacterium]|nr:primosomal protein N' [Planctomycetales bacterium]
MSNSRQTRLFSEADLPPQPLAWELAAEADQLLAEVVFNRPLTTAYHYLVPNELRENIGPGQRVQVPFGRGNKSVNGYCVGLSNHIPTGKLLKSITAVLDRTALIDTRMLELTHWIADRYLCGWGQVLESVIPAGVKTQAGSREVLLFFLGPQLIEQLQRINPDPAGHGGGNGIPEAVNVLLKELKLPAKQRAVIESLMEANAPMRVDQLTEAAQCGTGPIHALRDKGLIVSLRERVSSSLSMPAPEAHREIRLNLDQQRAVNTILGVVRSAEHRTILLHGVTGSGKTEVYIRSIEEIVSYGRQAIVLVPEISLTPQTIRRFASRFPSVAVLHSHLTDAERHGHWKLIASGAVQVVVGARSAVFAPTPHLGLIVIDEEHETSFKQDNTPRYHAREVARRRAEIEGIPLILGSATPTLESFLMVLRKQDLLISMPRRVEQLPLPPVIIVDTRNDPAIAKGSAIGRALFTSMQSALKAGGQIILFLNVRGFSPVLWCRGCGEGVKCPDCDITLTWHKERAVALCHSCDHSGPLPKVCPKCGKPGLLNLGIGTERLEAEVRTRFPHVKCLRMDSDTMNKRGSHDVALELFRHGEVQILLGTQMIAKGLDFPNVTLVGVIDADTLLHQPDIRSMERTFQLIAQVAGRTGRSSKGGRVLVQTASPEQPPIVRAAAHDFIGFATDELHHRKSLNVPPYSHLGRVILRGPVEKEVHAYADKVGELLREGAKQLSLEIRILGPAPCLVTRLKANYRYHLQLTATSLSSLHNLWKQVGPQFPNHPEVEYLVDVDPLNLR